MANLRIIFIPAKKISHLFPFKDRVPTVMQSLVVYKFRCASCNAQYVGKTARHLTTRVAEHQGISPRTQQPLQSPAFSAIREHSHRSGHSINQQDFSIVCKAKIKFDLSIMETLEIQRTMPSLNTMQSSLPLELFTTV